MSLQDWKIGTRLVLLAGVLAASTLVVGATGWMALKAEAAQMEAISLRSQDFQQSINLARRSQVSFKTQVQEWKNTLLRGGDSEAFQKYSKAFVEQGKVTQADLDELQALLKKQDVAIPEVAEARDAIDKLTRQYMGALANYDPANAFESARTVDKMVKGMDRPPTQKIDAIVTQVIEAAGKLEAQSLTSARDKAHAALTMIALVVLAALATGILLSWLIYRSITTPLKHAVEAAGQVAEGNLNVRLDAGGDNEVSQLNGAMSKMNDSLRNVVSQVRQAADSVSHASSEIASGNMDLSARTESQASNLQETVATISQLSTGVQHSADHAAEAQSLASRASEVAERGGSVVGDVVQTMQDINTSSRKISEIIGVIDGIAFQTNILALNAAVEAARAGEQGRGFAVVASEVRALAQRSANAAKEIKTLISASVECVDRGTSLVGEAGDTIASTVQAVQQVRDVVAEISVAAREQAHGISQVTQAIGAIDTTMQQNAALVEQAAAAAASLQQQAKALQDSVGFFQT